MSLHLRKRGRSTRTLVRIAYSKFFACENCMKDQASEYIEELLERPRMTSAERRRLEANLFCPNCEAHLDPHYDQVVSHTDEELTILTSRALLVSKMRVLLLFGTGWSGRGQRPTQRLKPGKSTSLGLRSGKSSMQKVSTRVLLAHLSLNER